MSAIEAAVQGAYAKLRAGDAAGAETLLAPMLAEHPDNPRVLQLMGLIAQAQGKLDVAVTRMRAACNAAPESAHNHNNLAVVLQMQGAHAEAAAHFRAALALDPRLLAARAGLARALAETGDAAEAEAAASTLLAADPSAAAWEVRAEVQQRLGRVDAALASLTEVVRQRPESMAHWGQLARFRWLRGDGEAFVAPLEAALRSRPTDAALRVETASLLVQAGYAVRAERLLREGAPHAASVRPLAAALTEQGRLDEALALIEQNPSPALRGDRAVLLLRLGQARAALEELRTLRTSRAEDQQLIALEALCLRALGDPAYAALYDYDRLVRTYDVAPRWGSVESFNAELAQSLRALHGSGQAPLDQTLRGGTQTGRDLRTIDDPSIKAFLAALDAPIRAYIAALASDDPVGRRRRGDYRLSGSWSVRLKPNGFHLNHVHDRGWISSAYYVDLPPDTAETETQAGWIKFGEPPWPMAGMGAEWVIQPRVGMLVLFPSYMWHGTIPFSGGAERLTAAFDVVPA